MPLPRRSSITASRTSCQRGAVADLDPQPPGQLGVADRPRQLALVEREGHLEDDEPPGLPLEPAVAVGEAALGRGQRALVLLGAVVHADGGDRLGDLLAVGADVLHRRRARRAGDAATAPPCRPAGRRRRRRPGRPTARRPGRSSRPPSRSIPRVRTATTSPGQPSSGATTLEPPPSSSSGRPASSASRTAATSSAASSTSISRSAGPPTASVVRSGQAGRRGRTCTGPR